MKAKQFLITGSAGQLAKEFQKLLKVCQAGFAAPPEKELDIKNREKLERTIQRMKPDVILNCAAYNFVDRAEQEPEQAFSVNAAGVKNLIEASESAAPVIVHFSTDYVFDGKKGSAYLEADKPNPLNIYGESKLEGENFLKGSCRNYFLIRLSWLFGEGENSFPIKVLKWSKEKRKLSIADDQISSPCYVGDIATCVLDLIDTGRFGLYHMTNSGFCSRYEWAEFILQKIGWQGELVSAKSKDFRTPARRPNFSVLDNSLLRETIGYSLPHWKDATETFL